jgi:cyclopropane-fatty-acyl-phospholipid synthase
MATQQDLDFTYTQIDRLFRLSMGEMGDFSGALYRGDFSLSLEEAQRRKHEFVAESLGVRPGMRIIDLGCGWGPMLNYFRSIGVHGVGVTLSRGQAEACRKNGLDVHLMDCRAVEPETFGTFDGAVSLGAFEHFCSREEFAAGRQDEIYGDLFAMVHRLLPPGGRFYLQTMVFGRNMIPPERISVDAPRLSDEHVLGLLAAQFPGSWLPSGAEQIERAAAPYFRLVSKSSGRLDYIETIGQWQRRFAKFGVRKAIVKLSLLPRYLFSKSFRDAFASGIDANRICFQRELLDHYRLVFERGA